MTIQVMTTDIISSNCYAMAEIHLDEICDDGYGLGLLGVLSFKHYIIYRRYSETPTIDTAIVQRKKLKLLVSLDRTDF